jgi:hypothetical protein
MSEASNSNQTLAGGITQAQLDKWKHQYGDISMIDVEYQRETYTCYIKKPDRNTVSFALSKQAADRPLESGEVILENCWLGGDQGIKDNDDIWMAAALRSRESWDLPQATIKKL